MARPRILLGVVAAWLIVVLVGSTAVWAVISQTGKELVPVSGPPIQAPAATRSASPAPPAASLAPPGEPIEQVPPPPPPATSTSESPSVPLSSSPAEPEDSEHSWSSSEGDHQATTRDSWKGKGGSVFAECSSRGLRVSAIADSGYRAEADDEDQRGRVVFEPTDGDGAEIRVYVWCTPDGPDFSVRYDDDHH